MGYTEGLCALRGQLTVWCFICLFVLVFSFIGYNINDIVSAL